MYYLLLLVAIFPKLSLACQPLISKGSLTNQTNLGVSGNELLLDLFIKSATWAFISLVVFLFYKYVKLLKKTWGKIHIRQKALLLINLLLSLLVLFWFLFGRILAYSILTPYSIGGCDKYEPSVWFTGIDYSVNLLTALIVIVFIVSAQKMKKLI